MTLTDSLTAEYATRTMVRMLQDIEPLFAAAAVYVIPATAENRSRLPSAPDHFGHVHGWTANNLDEQCRPYLESTGQWHGRGYAAIVNHRPALDSPAFVATVVHEASHWAEHAVTLAEHHSATFARAACHLQYRAHRWLSLRGYEVSLDNILSPRSLYPADAAAIARELGDEVQGINKPIVHHLRKPLPPAFARMFGLSYTAAPAMNLVHIAGKGLVEFLTDGRVKEMDALVAGKIVTGKTWPSARALYQSLDS